MERASQETWAAEVEKIRQAVPKIIDALIAKAQEGSCAQARFLFEIAGVSGSSEESAEAPPSLASLLMERLKSGAENIHHPPQQTAVP